MTRFKPCIALVTLLAAGCAGTSEFAGGDRAQDEAQATTPAAPAAAPAAAGSAAASPAVVDVNALVAATPAPLICRQMLKPNSNVIITPCLTAADWKLYQRRQEQNSQELVRMMQGGGYR